MGYKATSGGAGAGDMLKSLYDTNANGIVDKSEAIDDNAGNTASAADIKDSVTEKHIHSNTAELDKVTDGDHDVRIDNPHSVTKTQVSLANVDNIQQIPLSYLDTDALLAANSDAKVASQKAAKTYMDLLISTANALVYKGTINCSGNPNYPAADAGYLYIVSVAGKIGGASGSNVEVGDLAICNTDSTVSGDHATVGSSWNLVEKNIDGAVVGPAASVDENIVVFDGTTGKLIKDSAVSLANLSSAISLKHTQNTDTKLDEGGGNEVSAAQAKTAHTHSGVTTGNPHSVSKSDVSLGNVPNIDLATSSFVYIIDGGGSAIIAEEKDSIPIPFGCTITGVTLLADQSGSIVIDIWKDTYANYEPTVADTITASAKPTITTAIKSKDETLTGWTKTITAGDVLKFNVDSCTTIEKCTVSINFTRT